MRKRAVLGERDRPMEGSANLRRTRESEGAKESERDNIRDGGRERERERAGEMEGDPGCRDEADVTAPLCSSDSRSYLKLVSKRPPASWTEA